MEQRPHNKSKDTHVAKTNTDEPAKLEKQAWSGQEMEMSLHYQNGEVWIKKGILRNMEFQILI